MSSWNTLIIQGKFTSDGNNKTISLRSGFDYIEAVNKTALAQDASDLAFQFTQQRGQTDGSAFKWTKLGNVANDPVTVDEITTGGFYAVDWSGAQLGAAYNITDATNATEPVFDTADTSMLFSGAVVRLSNMVGQANLSGYDFSVDTLVTNTSFKMAAPLATAPGAAATDGYFRVVNFDSLFYPRFRYIANISVASSAVVTTTVPSGYAVGQIVRIMVPQSSQSGVSDYGMVQIDGLQGTITAVNNAVGTQTFTVDIDSSAFTAFTFPTAAKAAIALVKAIVVPVGMDVGYARAQSVDELSDARNNQGLIGVRMIGGASGPAGASSDVIYWKAWRADSVNNE